MKWCGDLTEIPTDEGKLYLATVEDLASRRLPGFALGAHHDAASKALDQAGFKLVASGLTYCLNHPELAARDGYDVDDVQKMFMKLAQTRTVGCEIEGEMNTMMNGIGWGGWVIRSLMMVGFWVLIAWVVVSLVRRRESTSSTADAQDILDKRFARCDIDADEYTRRRDELRAR